MFANCLGDEVGDGVEDGLDGAMQKTIAGTGNNEQNAGSQQIAEPGQKAAKSLVSCMAEVMKEQIKGVMKKGVKAEEKKVELQEYAEQGLENAKKMHAGWDKAKLLMKSLQLKKPPTITLSPGALFGIRYDLDTGEVLKVTDGGQAARGGVKAGMCMDQIDSERFKAGLLKEKMNDGKVFKVAFVTKCADKVVGNTCTRDNDFCLSHKYSSRYTCTEASRAGFFARSYCLSRESQMKECCPQACLVAGFAVDGCSDGKASKCSGNNCDASPRHVSVQEGSDPHHKEKATGHGTSSGPIFGLLLDVVVCCCCFYWCRPTAGREEFQPVQCQEEQSSA